jgi:hypothetical protein
MWLNKATKASVMVVGLTGRDLNLEPPKYEERMLSTSARRRYKLLHVRIINLT